MSAQILVDLIVAQVAFRFSFFKAAKKFQFIILLNEYRYKLILMIVLIIFIISVPVDRFLYIVWFLRGLDCNGEYHRTQQKASSLL